MDIHILERIPCGIDPDPRAIGQIWIEVEGIKSVITKAPFRIVRRVAFLVIGRAVAIRRELYPIGVPIQTLSRWRRRPGRGAENTVRCPIIIIIAMLDLP